MSRLPRRRPLLFTCLILSDRHHARFLRQDIERLSDDEIWAERKLLEHKLAESIWHGDQSVIFGSDVVTGTQELVTQPDWIRLRLRALDAAANLRRRGRAA